MALRGVVVGGGAFHHAGVPRCVLSVVDLDASVPVARPLLMEFLPHGFAFHPEQPTWVALFEKKGPGACVVDLQTERVLHTLVPSPGRRFYGHGAFTHDGRVLLATESALDDGAGALVARDAATGLLLGEVPTHGLGPHDCTLLDDGTTMVVAHGGSALHARGDAPSVTWVDVPSGRLLERVTLPSPRINAGHIAVNSRGDLAVVSAPRDGLVPTDDHLGAVTLRPAGRRAVQVQRPVATVRRMRGETLSVLLLEATRTVLATHPLGDCVTAWGLDDGRPRGTWALSEPRGLVCSHDGQWVLVSHRGEAGMVLSAYSAKTLEPTGFSMTPSFISGSHLGIDPLGYGVSTSSASAPGGPTRITRVRP